MNNKKEKKNVEEKTINFRYARIEFCILYKIITNKWMQRQNDREATQRKRIIIIIKKKEQQANNIACIYLKYVHIY